MIRIKTLSVICSKNNVFIDVGNIYILTVIKFRLLFEPRNSYTNSDVKNGRNENVTI